MYHDMCHIKRYVNIKNIMILLNVCITDYYIVSINYVDDVLYMLLPIHTAPVVPSIPEVFPTTDGMLVYPNIGCLTDDITNYNITVSYSLCCVCCTPYVLLSMFFSGYVSIYSMPWYFTKRFYVITSCSWKSF